jgi:hypothetical protein
MTASSLKQSIRSVPIVFLIAALTCCVVWFLFVQLKRTSVIHNEMEAMATKCSSLAKLDAAKLAGPPNAKWSVGELNIRNLGDGTYPCEVNVQFNLGGTIADETWRGFGGEKWPFRLDSARFFGVEKIDELRE